MHHYDPAIDERTGRQTSFAAEWHPDQTTLADMDSDCCAEACDCDELPGDWPCAHCAIEHGAEVPER